MYTRSATATVLATTALFALGTGSAHADTQLSVTNSGRTLAITAYSDWSAQNGAGDQCQIRVIDSRGDRVVSDIVYDPFSGATHWVSVMPGTYEIRAWCMNEAGPNSQYERTTTVKVTGR